MGCLLVADAAPARLKQPLQAEHHYAGAVGAANFRRYAPFLRIVQSTDPGALVARQELAAAVCVEEFMAMKDAQARLVNTMPHREEPNHTVAAMCAARLSEIKS